MWVECGEGVAGHLGPGPGYGLVPTYVRVKCGEGVAGHLGPGPRYGLEQGGLAHVREPYQAHVSHCPAQDLLAILGIM